MTSPIAWPRAAIAKLPERSCLIDGEAIVCDLNRLAVFDLLASEDKTLHANPGGHLDVPRAELGGAAHFLRRRLGAGGGSAGDLGGPVALAGVRYYVRGVPSPGDARWASVGLDV